MIYICAHLTTIFFFPTVREGVLRVTSSRRSSVVIQVCRWARASPFLWQVLLFCFGGVLLFAFCVLSEMFLCFNIWTRDLEHVTGRADRQKKANKANASFLLAKM